MQINQYRKYHSVKNDRKMKRPSGGNCNSKNVIYAARCRIHNEIDIGHTGEEIKERFHKHRYDTENTELAEHFSKEVIPLTLT